MNPNEVPTKGNLIRAKNSLTLAQQGYDLMDRKRNILIRELTELTEEAKTLQTQIDDAYRKAYAALERANVELGISAVQKLSLTVPIENRVQIRARSVMGTEIPLVRCDGEKPKKPPYAFYRTRDALDEATIAFGEVKDLTIRLAGIETSAHRLASEIQRTQKRANALKNITIPRYEELTKTITNALEEKEREEFTRLKIIKRQKNAG